MNRLNEFQILSFCFMIAFLLNNFFYFLLFGFVLFLFDLCLLLFGLIFIVIIEALKKKIKNYVWARIFGLIFGHWYPRIPVWDYLHFHNSLDLHWEQITTAQIVIIISTSIYFKGARSLSTWIRLVISPSPPNDSFPATLLQPMCSGRQFVL